MNVRMALAGVVAAACLAGCGLPGEERTQVVDDAAVPYDLLGAGETTPDERTDDAEVPRDVPVVFWVETDDRLAPAAVDVTCDRSPTDVVRAVLDALLASPTPDERDNGLASAIPSTARLALVQVEDGVAEVELDPVAPVDTERLPLAVGQVVLSVTSAPGVDAVTFVTSGQPVDLPLPGGALLTGAATPDDYAVLLPRRLADDPGSEIGCPPPT